MRESLVLDLDGPGHRRNTADAFRERLEAFTEAKRKASECTTLASVVADEIVPPAGAEIVDPRSAAAQRLG